MNEESYDKVVAENEALRAENEALRAEGDTRAAELQAITAIGQRHLPRLGN